MQFVAGGGRKGREGADKIGAVAILRRFASSQQRPTEWLRWMRQWLTCVLRMAPPLPRGVTHTHKQTNNETYAQTYGRSAQKDGDADRQRYECKQCLLIFLLVPPCLCLCVCVWLVVAPPLPPSVSLCVSLLVCLSVLFVAVSNTR